MPEAMLGMPSDEKNARHWGKEVKRLQKKLQSKGLSPEERASVATQLEEAYSLLADSLYNGASPSGNKPGYGVDNGMNKDPNPAMSKMRV